ncbi:MAG: alpha amylase C-terminal domain-containing protein, partial [Verrucomicrobia bacterium]|nr:alpha amylase C-terminal domain-containing protein [Verrucomicrobiota bacterium]
DTPRPCPLPSQDKPHTITNWGENDKGVWLIQNINSMIHNNYPGVISIAEDNSYGLGFDSEWEADETSEFGARVNWVLTQGSDAARDMNLIAGEINDGQNHGRVMFTESHDMVNEENGKQRLPRQIDGADPESIWARKRVLLGAALAMTSVGIPMVFQGQELLENWGFRPQNAMRWERATSQKGILDAYTDLIWLRRNLLGDTQGLKGTGCNVFHVDDGNKVVAYHRWDGGGVGDDVVVVLNFAATAWTDDSYWIDFPYAGDWYVVFNSDATKYGADFGDVGGTMVTASGNPPRAAVNMGMYGAMVFARSQHDKPSPGDAVVSPENPQNCEDVTIRYYPNDGDLDGVSPVHIQIGRNGWQNTVMPHPAMTWDSNAWVYTYSSTVGTHEINFVFHDATESLWDNNLNKDWDVTMVNCIDYDAPATTIVPENPTGCEPVTITYTPNDGVLSNASPVHIHIGFDGWSTVVSPAPAMTSTGESWTYTFVPPDDMSELNFVFRDAAGDNWDNNSGNDWNVPYTTCQNSQWINIQSPLDNIIVTNTAVDVSGTSSADSGPDFVILHAINGPLGSLSATQDWAFASASLDVGTNVISAVIPNDQTGVDCGDSASNSAYGGGTWVTGQSGGSGLGAWILSGGDNAGHFIADGAVQSNLEIGAKAWALWANSDNLADARRKFQDVLSVGSSVTLQFENHFIDQDKSVGIGLLNDNGDKLFEFYFHGGDPAYKVKDNSGLVDTGIDWTDGGLALQFTLLDPYTYALTVGSYTRTGTLVRVNDPQISTFRAWNYSAGPGTDFNFYINDLGVLGGQWAAFDAVTLIRTPAWEDLDTDGDGMLDSWEQEIVDADTDDGIASIEDVLPDGNFDGDPAPNYDEFIAGTDAMDPQEYLHIANIGFGAEGVSLRFPSRSGRKYLIWHKDARNAAANWINASPYQDIWGNNNNLTWSLASPDSDLRFFRLEVEKPN